MFIKRFFDIFVSICALILLSPIFVIIIFLLLLFNKGVGVFFYQKRPGKNGRIFNLIKLKTMTDAKDNDGNLLNDANRITKIGIFLRSSSLDELPQLINVLKGDMSLIGPRPLLVEYLPLYSTVQSRRHLVRPGMTGWAQINGRNSMKFSKRFEYDVWYVDHLNFMLDLKIIFRSIKKVLTNEGVINGQSAEDVDDLNFVNRVLKKE